MYHQERQVAHQRLVDAANMAIKSGADPHEVQHFFNQLLPLVREPETPPDAGPALLQFKAKAPAKATKPKITLPQAEVFEPWQDAMIGVGLLAIPWVGLTVNGSRGIAAASKVTIGIGGAVSAGFAGGGSLGTGLCVFPDGRLGWYGSVATLVGVIASISLTAQLTIVQGDKTVFGGECWGVGVAGGEEVVGNVAALLRLTGQFLGVTVGIGIGAGIPFEVFVEAQKTWTT